MASVDAGAIVDEADQLEAQLAVLEDAVGDHPAEIAGADDQHASQADAGAPAAPQQVAHDLARGVREDDVQQRGRAPSTPRETSR